IEADPFGKHQALGQRQPVEAKDQIDRQLGTCAVADRANMKTPGEQCIEHVFHFLSNRHVAADQRNSVATAYLIAGARDRHIQIANAARNNAHSARAATRSGSQVLMHSTIFSELSPSAASRWFPTTSSTCSVLNTATMTQRTGFVSSATDDTG